MSSIPTLYGPSKSESGPAFLSCKDNADPATKGKFLPFFKAPGSSLMGPPVWERHVWEYKAVLSPSRPVDPLEITPHLLFIVLHHLKAAQPDSPCAGHVMYLDTKTAKLHVVERLDLVPKGNDVADLMGKPMQIDDYYLNPTVDVTTGNPVGRDRLRALFQKTHLDIATAAAKAAAQNSQASTSGTTSGPSSSGSGAGASSRSTRSSGPFGTVAPDRRSGSDRPWGADQTTWANPYEIGCNF